MATDFATFLKDLDTATTAIGGRIQVLIDTINNGKTVTQAQLDAAEADVAALNAMGQTPVVPPVTP